MMVDPYESLVDVSTRIRNGTLSPVALVEACLARIDALNPGLNAFITVTAREARAAAKIAESEVAQGRWRGPLHGVPVAVKDFYDTAGIRTTAGYERFANRVPAKDAAVVARLKQAGAVIVGKTNMDALGMATTGQTSFDGPVRNPWNTAYVPGGSSSGSAAAVASGMCYATVDTDAIGSCRLPAACCGVVGFKGTYGLIDLEGILAGEAPPDEMIVWFSHAAATTRRVADAALLAAALQERSADTAPARLRVGAATNHNADRETMLMFEQAVEVISGLGYPIKKTTVTFAGPGGGLSTIKHDREIVAGQLFGDIDVVLLPTTTSTVPRVTESMHAQAVSPQNTAFANYFGIPAITVPCGFDSNGLPAGLQIVGRPSGDADVFALAREFEAATEWCRKHPSI